MKNNNQNFLFSPLGLNLGLAIVCILITVPASYSNYNEPLPASDSNYNEQYVACNRDYMCGPQTLQDSWYPFWGNNRPPYCGRPEFELKCHGNHSNIEMGAQSFQVFLINTSHQTMNLAPAYLFGDSCSGIFLQTVAIDHNLFSYSPFVRNLSLFYDCSGGLSTAGQNRFSCEQKDAFYTIDKYSGLKNLSNTCESVVKVPFLFSVPNSDQLGKGELIEVLKQGFEVRYQIADNESCGPCSSSKGICGSNQSSNGFACLCHDGPHSRTCLYGYAASDNKLYTKVAGVIAATVVGIIIMGIIIYNIFGWKKMVCLRKMTKTDKDLEAFIRNHGTLAPKRYKFSDIKHVTSSFKNKLGQGGYGSVYKGKLSDGHLVAVKLLNNSKGDGKEFMNEVASISRTSHVNIVTLLGFCLEGNKRALIYEFMPNGSLDKFICSDQDNISASQELGWEQKYQIILGIARGLEYLHRGCCTRILHFDIKPHNILLNEDFCPKISDFGLAKLCPKRESIVSLLEMRGTIGYIAPEVFSRNFGNVSHKSDVYSFGMMIIELIMGCRRTLNDSSVKNSGNSELYFPNCIYRHLEEGKEFELPGAETREETEIAKKMIIVGLWCIQTRPSDRPSIEKVLDMLHGSIEALQIPPMPILSSPPRLLIHSSATPFYDSYST